MTNPLICQDSLEASPGTSKLLLVNNMGGTVGGYKSVARLNGEDLEDLLNGENLARIPLLHFASFLEINVLEVYLANSPLSTSSSIEALSRRCQVYRINKDGVMRKFPMTNVSASIMVRTAEFITE